MADVVHLGPAGRQPRPLLRTLVGEVLRRHRRQQRRTLAEVAREACVSMPYLSEVERGRKEPSSEVLAAVCGSLRIELADLLAEVRRELVEQPAPVLRLDTRRLDTRRLDTRRLDTTRLETRRLDTTRLETKRRAAPPAGRSGDVVLLAA